MFLYNTLTKKIEKFAPLNPPIVTFYSCGPTVYDFTHIGHLRTYTNNDVLKRTLIYLGFKVKHVMNITDVGHLTGDDDTGEDKLEKGAKKTGRTVYEIAEFYTQFFLESIKKLNIFLPDILCKATDHIKEMINLIQILEKKGYTYQTSEAVYFNVEKFKKYGQLSGQKLSEKIQKAREEVHLDPEKKHPADFALWFKCVGRFANHVMRWQSPWGVGFPGWHIECSAMSMKYLGSTIDIHAGGIDHIPVHHENEIAQSESATGKPFVRFWFHNNFLTVDNQKMSKSLGNFYTIKEIEEKGFNPLALRYLFLQSHYRQVMNFTWQTIQSAQNSFDKLKEIVLALKNEALIRPLEKNDQKAINHYKQAFTDAVSNDLNLPQALAIFWQMIKSKISPAIKLKLIEDFDQLLGLNLLKAKEEPIPQEILILAQKRQKARKNKDFIQADKLREKINRLGYNIEDLPNNQYKIKKIPKSPKFPK
jgi:cysteinyl-tRNA synthetase